MTVETAPKSLTWGATRPCEISPSALLQRLDGAHSGQRGGNPDDSAARPPMTDVHADGVVVGVDGSAASAAALDFGMREAARRRSALKVITAWMPDGAAGGGARRRAQRVQDDAVATALQRNPSARPLLSRLVVSGEAGAILLLAAECAAYLVLGSSAVRSASGQLGSVGAYCVRHATVPVLVVPQPARVTEAASLPARPPASFAPDRAC